MESIILQRYKIIKTLSQGQFGDTLIGEDISLNPSKLVIIKKSKTFSTENKLSSQVIEELLKKEVQIWQDLAKNNSSILNLENYVIENNQIYLVQEYIKGNNLAEFGIITSEQCKTLLFSLLDTLKYLHNQNIIHSNIKPTNIIFRDENINKPILTDFGSIKEMIEDVINPSHVIENKVFSSDIYALGLSMIYALTGKYSFELSQNPSTGELKWTNYAKDLDQNLMRVLNKAINLDLNARYPTAVAMDEDLRLSCSQNYEVKPSAESIDLSDIIIDPVFENNIDNSTPKTIPIIESTDSMPITDSVKPSSNNNLKIMVILIFIMAGLLGGFLFAYNQQMRETQAKLKKFEKETEKTQTQLEEIKKEKTENENILKDIQRQREDNQAKLNQIQQEKAIIEAKLKELELKQQERDQNKVENNNQDNTQSVSKISPKDFLEEHYQSLSDKDYGKAWNDLSSKFIADNNLSYEIYEGFWKDILQINVDNINLISEEENAAKLQITFSYQKNDQSWEVRNNEIDLIYDQTQGKWLMDHKSDLTRRW